MANATNPLVGRSVGNDWAVFMATSGHFCWPPMGSSQRPLTLGTDGGIDVTSFGAIAQVKHFTNSPVGAPHVQQLIGAARSRTHGIFYALNGYTAAAGALAEKTDTALFQYTLGGEVEARSSAASELLQTGFVAWQPNVETGARAAFSGALEQFGQSTIDNCIRICRACSDEAGQHNDSSDAKIEERASLLSEARMILTLVHVLASETTFGMQDLVGKITRIESLGHQLATRLGIDYDEPVNAPAGQA